MQKTPEEVTAEFSVTKQTFKPLLGLPASLLPGIRKLSILNTFDLSDLDETAPSLLVSPALQTLH